MRLNESMGESSPVSGKMRSTQRILILPPLSRLTSGVGFGFARRLLFDRELLRTRKSALRWRWKDASRSTGFTLVELLVVVLVIGILASLMLPAIARSKATAHRVKCISNLRQLALAAHFYWDENTGKCFRYGGTVTNGGQLYWFGWIGTGPEGDRLFDSKQGALDPYLRGRGIEVCPAFDYTSSQLKLKATGSSFGYGYNWFLSSPLGEPTVSTTLIARPSDTTLFADAAQVNTWQAPASPTNPMLEEWYYVDTSTNQPNGHFRHRQRANVVFSDSHVGTEKPVQGSLDARMPGQFVGRLREEILRLP